MASANAEISDACSAHPAMALRAVSSIHPG